MSVSAKWALMNLTMYTIRDLLAREGEQFDGFETLEQVQDYLTNYWDALEGLRKHED